MVCIVWLLLGSWAAVNVQSEDYIGRLQAECKNSLGIVRGLGITFIEITSNQDEILLSGNHHPHENGDPVFKQEPTQIYLQYFYADFIIFWQVE